METLTKICATAVALGCFLAYAQTCTCPFPEPSRKTRHCQADFSVIGRTYDNGTTALNGVNHRKYCLDVVHVFKPTNMYSSIKCVYTPFSSAACGITFNEGQTYILNGDIIAHRLHVNSCGWNEAWAIVPLNIKSNIFNALWCSSS